MHFQIDRRPPSTEEMAQRLTARNALNGARVPGEGQHIRFSYAASKAAIEQGVARMAEFIRKNQRRVA